MSRMLEMTTDKSSGDPGRKHRILVCDDNPIVRAPLSRMLSMLGFEPTEVCDGQEAVETVEENPDRFSLIFLDMDMPRMDGREALGHLRRLAPAVPVVVITGGVWDGSSGVDPKNLPDTILRKPFSFKDIKAAVALLSDSKAG